MADADDLLFDGPRGAGRTAEQNLRDAIDAVAEFVAQLG
jgi:hypothetical protein